jgi:preprotein translocase subunit SecG
MLYALLVAIHVLVSVVLILVVLLQTGKRADLAGAFGGGGSQTAFGPRGTASVLSKATTVSAVMFMVTSLALSILSSQQSGSRSTVLDDVDGPEQSAPAIPGLPSGEDFPAPTDSGLPAPDEAPAEDATDTDTEPVDGGAGS